MSTPRKEPGPTSTVTTPSDRDIRIERIFNAPRDRVWRAYTDLGGDDTMNKVTPFLMFNDQLEAAVKDPRKVEAVIDAMMKMVKLDVAALERAYAGA